MTLREATDKAVANGHHLASDHLRVTRRWTCVACDLQVICDPDGRAYGSAVSHHCRPPQD